jgi:hypothetical protein
VHRLFEHRDLRPAAFLGGVEGGERVTHQLLWAHLVGLCHGDTNARRELDLSVFERERPCEVTENPLGGGGGFLRVFGFEQDGELVAAEMGDRVAGPDALDQTLGE